MCFSVKRIEKGVQIADNTHDVIFHMDILHIYIYIYMTGSAQKTTGTHMVVS